MNDQDPIRDRHLIVPSRQQGNKSRRPIRTTAQSGHDWQQPAGLHVPYFPRSSEWFWQFRPCPLLEEDRAIARPLMHRMRLTQLLRATRTLQPMRVMGLAATTRTPHPFIMGGQTNGCEIHGDEVVKSNVRQAEIRKTNRRWRERCRRGGDHR